VLRTVDSQNIDHALAEMVRVLSPQDSLDSPSWVAGLELPEEGRYAAHLLAHT
jgi:hypothetical protein